jgi:hypothetical protein
LFWIEQGARRPLALAMIARAYRVWRRLLGADHANTQRVWTFLQERLSPEERDRLEVSQPPNPGWAPFSASADWPPGQDA